MKKAQNIAKQGAQDNKKVDLLPWPRAMSSNELNADCQAISRPRSRNAPLNGVGELCGDAPQRCPSPPKLGHWQPFSSSAGWTGQLPAAHTEQHAIQDLKSTYLLRGSPLVPACSGRAQTLRGGTERVPPCDCPPTPLPSRLEPDSSRCTMLLLPRPPSLLQVGRFGLLSRPPPPPPSLSEQTLPVVAVGGYITA